MAFQLNTCCHFGTIARAPVCIHLYLSNFSIWLNLSSMGYQLKPICRKAERRECGKTTVKTPRQTEIMAKYIGEIWNQGERVWHSASTSSNKSSDVGQQQHRQDIWAMLNKETLNSCNLNCIDSMRTIIVLASNWKHHWAHALADRSCKKERMNKRTFQPQKLIQSNASARRYKNRQLARLAPIGTNAYCNFVWVSSAARSVLSVGSVEKGQSDKPTNLLTFYTVFKCHFGVIPCDRWVSCGCCLRNEAKRLSCGAKTVLLVT